MRGETLPLSAAMVDYSRFDNIDCSSSDDESDAAQTAPPPPPSVQEEAVQEEELTQEQEVERVIKNFVVCSVEGDIEYIRHTLSMIPRFDEDWQAAWRARGGLDALGYDPRLPENIRLDLGACCDKPALWLEDERGVEARANHPRDHYPALCAAAMGGELEAVKLLLNPASAGGVGIAPASPTAATMHVTRGGVPVVREPRYLAIHCAAIEGHADVIEALLAHPAVDVDQRSPRKEDRTTPIFLAARYSKLAAVRMLLKHGADIHLRDTAGLQPVHYLLFATEAPGDDDNIATVIGTPAAPKAGAPDHRYAVARALLERGADPHAPNTQKSEKGSGETLAEQAAGQSMVGLFKALAQGARGPGEYSPAVLGDPAAPRESPERKRFDNLRLIAKNVASHTKNMYDSGLEHQREEEAEWNEARDGPYVPDEEGHLSRKCDRDNAKEIFEIVESYGRSRGWSPPSPKPKLTARKTTHGKVPRKQLATKAARTTRPGPP